MRSLTITLALLATTLTSTQAISQVGGSHYNVELNKTKIVRLPQAASAVLVGNPDIADVSVHSVNTLFVVGRGYGETNLIVLGANGQEIMDANLTVVNTLSNNGVRLYNAKQRETYSCLPFCQPSPILGDSPAFIGSNSNTEPALGNSVALGASTTPANTGGGASSNGGSDLAGGNSNQEPVDSNGSSQFGSGF